MQNIPISVGPWPKASPPKVSCCHGKSEADMTVRAGREFLAVPGPTNIPDEVLQAMHRPAVEIYSEPLIALTDGLFRDLGKVFGSATRPYIYIANGHGAWEAALTNVLSRGDKILVLESGQFAMATRAMPAARLGVEVEVLAGDWRHAVRPSDVEARLRADKGGEIKAILAVQIETSTGVANDIAAIGAAVKAAWHDALYVVDVVASLGCVPFAMDAWGVDVAVSGSQKGLMSPPGLGFVAAPPPANAPARPTARPAFARPPGIGRHATASRVLGSISGTPPEQLLFALRKALDMLFAEGLDNVFLRHRLLAEAVRRAVAVWKQGDVINSTSLKRVIAPMRSPPC